jgi:hypothetical protein
MCLVYRVVAVLSALQRHLTSFFFFLLIFHGEGSAPSTSNFLSTPFIHWSRVSILFLFAPNMLLIFSTFRCTLCDFHLSARVPQVVCVPLFFPFIYSRCCTFAPHKANKFIYLLFPIFFFIYFACLISCVCLLARAKEK